MKYNQLLKWASDLLYYLTTSVWSASHQTIGEEYADIIAVHKHLPLTILRKLSVIVMLVFSPFCFRKLFIWLKKYAERSSTPDVNVARVEMLKRIFSGPLLSCQLALFYFTGAHYHISRMVFQTRYILLRNFRKGEMQGGYEILGVLILVRLLVTAVSNTSDGGLAADYDDTNSMESSREQCTLCLGPRKDSTAAVCGHVYCWRCLADWIRTKPECPLCRNPIDHKSMVPLANF